MVENNEKDLCQRFTYLHSWDKTQTNVLSNKNTNTQKKLIQPANLTCLIYSAYHSLAPFVCDRVPPPRTLLTNWQEYLATACHITLPEGIRWPVGDIRPVDRGLDHNNSVWTMVNPLDPTTAAAGCSVQSWNSRRRLPPPPHTSPSIKKILVNNY